MNDILGLGKTVTEGLQLLKEPVQSMFGPAWNEFAGYMGDAVRNWRDMRRLARALSSVTKLQALGLTPKAVDPSILFPLLDAASLVDNPSLTEKWDNLLATASIAKEPHVILPAYIEILRQLIPIEAAILDWMYAARFDDGTSPNISRESIIEQFAISGEDYVLFASDLHRLQVIDGRRNVNFVNQEGYFDTAGLVQASESHYWTIGLTPLGIAFINACQQPSASV
jgi:Abortive infection alpha